MTSPSEEYRLIPLSQGQFAKVDISDFDWLNQWKWHAKWNHSTKSFYAIRRLRGSDRRVRMHNFILGIETGSDKFPDHINRDTLDNRRENLRITTCSENLRNRKRFSNNTSGHTGVSYNKGHRKWIAYLSVNGKIKIIGEYDIKEDAISARQAAEKAHYGVL